MLRIELKEALCQYISDTLSLIETVRDFCNRHSKWSLQRETELLMMGDIKDRAGKVVLEFQHVSQSQNKMKALGEYIKSGLTQMSADKRREELKAELGEVLKDTLAGLGKLEYFLDAVEKLASSSLYVFADEGPFSGQGMSPANIRAAIIAARQACPLLVHFKRNAAAFFVPSLFNLQVLEIQLDKYINVTQQICDTLEKNRRCEGGISQTESTFSYIRQMMFWRKKNEDLVVDMGTDVSDESMLNMLLHLKVLNDIRSDQHLRLVFLFQEESERFIELFSQCKPRMQQFLIDLEESAVQLDNMKFGAKISSVTGSSVGVVGGILSIVGIALAPVTAGVSLALTMTGLGLGVTSGVNSIVTTVTETAVNSAQQKKVNEVFQGFMEDMQSLQCCIENVGDKMTPSVGEVDIGSRACMIAGQVGAIGKGIDSLIDGASGVKLLMSDEVITGAGNLLLQEGNAVGKVPSLASDIPDLGQVAKGTPLALSKSARAGFITLNALFIGLDVFFICKDSVSLAKGSKSEVSLLVRDRAKLWRSEMDSWQTICDSLGKGLLTAEDNQDLLEMPFYPVEEMTREKKGFCMVQ